VGSATDDLERDADRMAAFVARPLSERPEWWLASSGEGRIRRSRAVRTGELVQRATHAVANEAAYTAWAQVPTDKRRYEAAKHRFELPAYTFRAAVGEWLDVNSSEQYTKNRVGLVSRLGNVTPALTTGTNTLTVTKGTTAKLKQNPVTMTFDVTTDASPLARADLTKTVKLGTEFTFTCPEMITAARAKNAGQISTAKSQEYLGKWVTQMTNCPDAPAHTQSVSKYGTPVHRWTYADGWWYQAGLDPGVIETQMKPMTLEESTAMAARVTRDVFGTATTLGLAPDATYGGGHIHLEVAGAFGDDAALFRRFLVDFESHAAAMEAFEHDPVNAPLIAHRELQVRERFAAIISEFDKGGYNGPNQQKALLDLAETIESSIYGGKARGKYAALNFRHMLDPNGLQTIEIRALQAQRTFDDFLLEADMLLRRIKWLEQQQPAAYDPKPGISSEASTPLDFEQVLSALTKYVEEIGLGADDFALLAKNYRRQWEQAVERDKQ
jgi:hypothetical protein